MDRAVRLIVNPSAGGGRAARELPAVEAALRSHGVRVPRRPHDVDRARARARPRGRAAAARSRRRWAATGSPARWRASCGAPTRVMAVLPGGRGNDFARKLGIGADPVGGGRRADGGARAADRRRRGRRAARIWASSAPGFDSDVQEIANATRLRRSGRSSTSTARCARCGAGTRREWDVTIDGTAHSVHRLLGRGLELGRLRRRHVARARTPSSTTGCSTSCSPRDQSRDRVPARPAEGVQGHARRRARASSSCAAARSRSRPTGRSPPTPTATRSPTLPVTVRVAPGALRVIAP